jgi:hypothetical protein
VSTQGLQLPERTPSKRCPETRSFGNRRPGSDSRAGRSAGKVHHRHGHRPPIGLASPGEVKCHGALPTGNPFGPCPPGTSGTVRGRQRIFREDTSDARTKRLNYGTFNANIHEDARSAPGERSGWRLTVAVCGEVCGRASKQQTGAFPSATDTAASSTCNCVLRGQRRVRDVLIEINAEHLKEAVLRDKQQLAGSWYEARLRLAALDLGGRRGRAIRFGLRQLPGLVLGGSGFL